MSKTEQISVEISKKIKKKLKKWSLTVYYWSTTKNYRTDPCQDLVATVFANLDKLKKYDFRATNCLPIRVCLLRMASTQ